MIYDFTIKETSKTVVPVRAKNPDEAQKIFTTWYEKHDGDPTDSTITDLLDNGYEGREIIRSVGMSEEKYPIHAVMLPEESPTPVEPRYTLHIRFADGSKPVTLTDRTLQQIGQELSAWGEKYYLFPDAGEGWLMCKKNEKETADSSFWIYAALKDKEETWFEME